MSNHHDSKFVQTVNGTLERPRYSPGLILEDSDLTAAVDYTRDLNRLMFRSLFGCGVVCGLTATAEDKCGLTIVVNPGLAIAPCGDPINVSRAAKFTIDKPDRTDYWILLRNKQRTSEHRSVMCDEDDDDAPSQPTRIKDCAEVSLTCDLPPCACAHWQLRNRLVEGFGTAADLLVDKDTKIDKEIASIDCPSCSTDCGCGCDDYIVIGWVHKFGDDWGVLHNGVRRFIRPCLQPDPYPNADPRKPAPVTEITDKPPVEDPKRRPQ